MSRSAAVPPSAAPSPAAAPDAHPLPGDGPEARVAIALARILEAPEFPAFSRQMSELLATLESPEHSAQRLANAVLRDYSLTLKVVRTANAAHYNRSGRAIRSVTQAMMLLGVQTVRALATGLLLFEHYQHRATGLRELLLLSLVSASHARQVALRLGLAEPEAVHLCGMCRNLGEVLVACHFPAAYGTILRQARERLAADAAAVPDVRAATATTSWQVLGFGFDDLGEAMLAHWGMPVEVRRSVRASGRPGESQLQIITAFAHELTTTVYRADVAPALDAPGGRAPAVGAVLEKYGARLRLSPEVLREVLAAALDETRELFADAGVSLDGQRLAWQTTAALAALGDAEASAALAGLAERHAAVLAERALRATPAGGTPTDGAALAALRARLLGDLELALPAESGHELHAVMLLVLEALLRGGPCDRAAFCLVSADRARLEPRIVLGDGTERLQRALAVSLVRTLAPLARVLRRAEPATLRDERAAPPDEARWVRGLGARRASVLPLVVSGTVIGCLYGDALGEGGASDPETRAFLVALGEAAVQAVMRRRGEPATAPVSSAG